LTTVLEFIDGEFPVGDAASSEHLRGLSFSGLSSDEKKAVFSYQFAIEFLPSTDEGTLNNIFDRINRNVSRLTPQELRHARFSGPFAKAAEELAEELPQKLRTDFPRFVPNSRRQMKDVELVVQLLLLVEAGAPSQHSQASLDTAYGEREDEWEDESRTKEEYRSTIDVLSGWVDGLCATSEGKRFGNQADFYSLFAAVHQLTKERALPAPDRAVEVLTKFMAAALSPESRLTEETPRRYYEATRSASSDVGPRKERTQIVRDLLAGV
jgi:hypothetical protein